MGTIALIDVPENEARELEIIRVVELTGEEVKDYNNYTTAPSFEANSNHSNDEYIPENVNMELSYWAWFPPNLVQKGLGVADNPFMVVQSKIGARSYQGTAAIKISAKDDSHFCKIPRPPASDQLAIAGVSGLTTMKNTASDWGRLIRIFKKCVGFVVSALLIYWNSRLGYIYQLYNKANQLGLGPRFPWDSDKKERVRIFGMTGDNLNSAKYEFKMDSRKSSDLNQNEIYKLGWDIPSDVKNLGVFYNDTKFNDNDGHVKGYLGFFG